MYTGYLLSESSRNKLLSLFPPKYHDVVCHHITEKFGVPHDAQVPPQPESFVVIGYAENSGPGSNSNENASNNLEKNLLNKFFKKINSFMPNVDEIHVTGTGQIQEQYIHQLAETPQYKNVISKESTANKMSDEKLIEFISGKFA